MTLDQSDLQVMQDYLDKICEECFVPRETLWDLVAEDIKSQNTFHPASDNEDNE